MRILFFLLFICTAHISHAQPVDKELKQRRQAFTLREDTARKQAHADIKKGKMIYYNYGFASGANTTAALIKLLKEKYHITYISVGCIVEPEYTANNEVIDAYLKKKYGSNFWSDIKMEAGIK